MESRTLPKPNNDTLGETTPRMARALNEQETRYMTGGREPVTSSVLISNSRYLNSPLYRDVFAQMALRRQGSDVPTTYLVPAMIRAITEVTNVPEFLALIAAERQTNSEFAAWLDERRITHYRPGTLEHHPAGTLGAAIRAFVEAGDMNMDFAMQGEIAGDLDYMKKRQAMSHDLEHLATGFAPNQFGEVALGICNNVAVANYFSPGLAAYISAGALFLSATSYARVSLHYPAALPGYFEALRLGIVAGQKLKKPLFMVRWEDYLDRPLEDIAADLGIERGPAEAWNHSTALTMD
jgi:ubiquinone biosynthesis protein COQ4